MKTYDGPTYEVFVSRRPWVRTARVLPGLRGRVVARSFFPNSEGMYTLHVRVSQADLDHWLIDNPQPLDSGE